jgi:hypothetical protein
MLIEKTRTTDKKPSAIRSARTKNPSGLPLLSMSFVFPDICSVFIKTMLIPSIRYYYT